MTDQNEKQGGSIGRRSLLKGALAGSGAALGMRALNNKDGAAAAAQEYRYRNAPGLLPDMLASLVNNKLYDPLQKPGRYPLRRLLLKGGSVVDPKNGIDGVRDILIEGKYIVAVGADIKPERGDRIKDVSGLHVFPGLIDIHNHMHDLFEITTDSVFEAAANGNAVNLSPGAGNTFIGPALLMGEVDRGVPTNVSLYMGNPCLAAARATVEDKIAFFRGELPMEEALQKITRNRIANLTAPLVVGIKDHHNHCIQSDEAEDAAFEICAKAGMLFQSHTQDPVHSERLVNLSRGRPLHLGHCTASGAGTHMDAARSQEMIGDFVKSNSNVSGQYVTSMLRIYRGSWEGLVMDPRALKIAYDHLAKGVIRILVSDGQLDATMKGFGDSRDNIPCIYELAEQGVLTLSQAVATMTINPARLFEQITGQGWWTKELGHLGVGARANVTVADKRNKMARITIVNGVVAGFEGRAVRAANGTGGWVSRHGIIERTGVGDLAMWAYAE